MKPLTVVVALAALAAPAAAARAQAPQERIRLVTRSVTPMPRVAMYQRSGDEQTERQTKSFKIGDRGDIQVSNIAGDITISRGSGSDATIDVVKRARSRSVDEAREMLKLVQVEITERNGHIEVRTQYPQGDRTQYPQGEMRRSGRRNINVSVDVTITAPANTRFAAHSISGNLKATDIKGDLSLETISGAVTISGANRVSSAKTLSGDVTISDTQADGSIEASSVSGMVTLRKVRARAVDLGSVSGTVSVDEIECERADMHSFSGNVEYGGSFAPNGRYELKSHSGDVRVTTAGKTGFELEATTFSGTLRSDLQIQTVGGEGSWNRGRRSLRGTYGDGSAVVQITTFSGGVVLSKR